MQSSIDDDNKMEALIRWQMLSYAKEHQRNIAAITEDKIVLKLLRDPLVDIIDSFED